MDKRFASFFNLTEEKAIAVLDTPQAQISENDSRYIAASHLVNFPTEQSIQALIRAVYQTDPGLDNRIVRRKALETLGRLKASQAIPAIRSCLADGDCYTVENAVWAIGEIGTQDLELLEEVAQLLDRPNQSYRVIIHTLTNLDYEPALARIRRFMNNSDAPIASAAIAGVCRLSKDYSQMDRVVAMLQHPNVLGRRLSIQDLMDARYYDAIPQIARCPVSLVFRLRGIRTLAERGITEGAIAFETMQIPLEQTLRDHPGDLDLVHVYKDLPPLSVLIRDLYETDFGRCYLASKTILENYADVAPAALFQTYEEEACNDYGAHFHVVKLFGWLNHTPAQNLLLAALENSQPQFQKSRAAAAIALGELGDPACIPFLKASLATNIWDLKYAALMALEKLGDTRGREMAALDSDWLVRAKAASLSVPIAC
ncbi:MAG: HEAT repeat domain-containing protein [Snowella sp.]|nr:HEAT repeat domain-containing protein [Snowella sp.]